MTLMPERLCRVRVKLRGGKSRSGTGYAITPEIVLTAYHITALKDDETGNLICREAVFDHLNCDPVELKAQVAFDETLDIALWSTIESVSFSSADPIWGQYDRHEPYPWESVGFPRAAKLDNDGDKPERLRADARGQFGPHGGGPTRLELGVDFSPPPTEWPGMSGAPVFADGRLVGVIRTVPIGFKGSRLYATPAEKILELETVRGALGDVELDLVPLSPLDSNLVQLPVDSANVTPSALLIAAHEVVPFHANSRRTELTMLKRLCDSPQPVEVCLITGEGGAGKTRLLIEWCKQLRGRGWIAGFLPAQLSNSELERIVARPFDTCIVIDYAEARPGLSGELENLIKSVAQRTRIVLLAREAGEWWEALCEASPKLEDLAARHTPVCLQTISADNSTHAELIHKAYLAFQQRLGVIPSTVEAVPFYDEISSAAFTTPLELHMAALTMALDSGNRGASVAEVTKRILSHEQRFWYRAYPEQRLDWSAFRRKARRFVAAVTLLGGVSLTKARELRTSIDGPDDDFLDFLQRVYPLRIDNQRSIGPLKPDLLGEALVIRVLENDDEEKALLCDTFNGATSRELTHGFLVMGRISIREPDRGVDWLQKMLEADPNQRIFPALDAAISLAPRSAADPLALVLAQAMPEHGTVEIATAGLERLSMRTVALLDFAIWATERVYEESQSDQHNINILEFVSSNLTLSRVLRAAGRLEESIEHGEFVVYLWKSTIRIEPRYGHELAIALDELGATLQRLNRFDEAERLHRVAVEKLFEEPIKRPAEAARAARRIGIVLLRQGRLGEASDELQRAHVLHQQLHEHMPNTVRYEIPEDLCALAQLLHVNGQDSDALNFFEPAILAIREIVSEEREEVFATLGELLSNYSRSLRALERVDDALVAAQESMEIFSRLIKVRSEAFWSEFCSASEEYINTLKQADRHMEAAQTWIRMIESFREVETLTGLNRIGLARALCGLAEMVTIENIPSPTELLHEAVKLLREVEQNHPELVHADLLRCLSCSANHLNKSGLTEAAIPDEEEAVTIARDQYLAGLSSPLPQHLAIYAKLLFDLGRQKEAHVVQRELDELVEVTKASDVNSAQSLAQRLVDFGLAQHNSRRFAAAVATLSHAVRILVQVHDADQTQPAAEAVASCQMHLAESLRALGRDVSALYVEEDAFVKAKDLFEKSPEQYRELAARSLEGLGRTLRVRDPNLALDVLEQALSHRARLATNDSKQLPRHAETIELFAKVLLDQHDSQKAFEMFDQALEVRRAFVDVEPIQGKEQLAGYLERLIEVYKSLHRPHYEIEFELEDLGRAPFHSLQKN